MRIYRVFAMSECTALGRIIPSSPPRALLATAATLIALVLGAVAWTALTEADLVVRAPARIRAKHAPQVAFSASSGERVVAQTSGRVVSVTVHEGTRVGVGDVLATIDVQQVANDLARLESALDAARSAHDATARMQGLATAQFEAAQATRRAELAQVTRDEERGRSRRDAEIRLARTAVETAEREVARVRLLEGDGAASPVQVEQAQARLDEATARLSSAMVSAAGGRAEVLRRQIEQADREFDVRREELAQELRRQTAEVAAAERHVENSRLELAKGRIVADTAGIVSSVSVTAGDVVQPAQAMFVISPEDGLRVDAAVAVADVGRLRVGMPVRIRIDAFDWQRYGTANGVIQQISPDAERVDAARGGALVYTVRIDLESEELGHGDLRGSLKLGMTGMVEVITGREQLLAILLGRMHQAFSLGG